MLPFDPKTAFSFTFEGDLLASCSGLDTGAQGDFVCLLVASKKYLTVILPLSSLIMNRKISQMLDYHISTSSEKCSRQLMAHIYGVWVLVVDIHTFLHNLDREVPKCL